MKNAALRKMIDESYDRAVATMTRCAACGLLEVERRCLRCEANAGTAVGKRTKAQIAAADKWHRRASAFRKKLRTAGHAAAIAAVRARYGLRGILATALGLAGPLAAKDGQE